MIDRLQSGRTLNVLQNGRAVGGHAGRCIAHINGLQDVQQVVATALSVSTKTLA
jgi:hypothetical protein